MEEAVKTTEQQPVVTSHCSGDCMKCHPAQRGLCASQMSYYNMKQLEQMQKDMQILKNINRRLDEKIEALQNNEAHLFEPVRPEGNAQ